MSIKNLGPFTLANQCAEQRLEFPFPQPLNIKILKKGKKAQNVLLLFFHLIMQEKGYVWQAIKSFHFLVEQCRSF